jgi:hypothetical protein
VTPYLTKELHRSLKPPALGFKLEQPLYLIILLDE